MRDLLRLRLPVRRLVGGTDIRAPRRPRRPIPRFWLAMGIVALMSVAAIAVGIVRRERTPRIPVVPISEIATAMDQGEVAELVIHSNGNRVTATLKEPRTVAGLETRRVSAAMPMGALELSDLERWAATGAKVRVDSSRAPADYLPLAGAAIVIGLMVFLVFRAQRGEIVRRRFGRAPSERRLTLQDVGGVREAQADVSDVIAYLADPDRFEAVGATCPKGILLVGPPGTGKTLLARAVAGEAGRPVIIASGSEFTEMYVGVGARRVRELAKQARAQAPCIVFIDEFDSIGGRRGRPNRTSEEESTLNQLLVEMDGLSGSEGVVWMAATNRDDMLDPAVRRPGRFDRVVEVGMPTRLDRLEILRIHASKRPLGNDVDLEKLAALTVGYSGADLANLLNEAAILAVQDGSKTIHMAHIEQARDKIMLGRVRAGVVVSDEERRLVAIHEAGHAIVGLVACPDDKLHKVTIEARGRSLGAAHFAPDTDRYLYSRRYLEGTIAKALGGRAAETIFLGPEAITSGAGSDLVQATTIARKMVAEFGMSVEVGLVSADSQAQGGAPSAQLQAQIDGAVRSLIAQQAARAEAIVEVHRDAVEALANALLDHNVLSASEVQTIAEEYGVTAERV